MRKLMRRLTVAAVLGVAAGVGMAPNTVLAEQPAGAQKAQEYYYTVVGGSAKEPNRIRPWSEPFDTAAAAQARLNSILRDHSKGGRLEFDTDSPRGLKILKEPKAPNPAKDVDDAAKKAKQVLTDAERKVGDTLKEYTSRITAAYEDATKAKAGMTALTGKIARQQFEDVNKQIDGFNGLRTEASQKVGVAGESLMARYPTMSRVTPQDLKGQLEDSPPATQTASLAGKRGSGKFGQSTIDVEFQEGGKVIFRDPDSNNEVLNEGTWSQTDDEVVMNTKRFAYKGKVTKSGADGQRTEDGKQTPESWNIAFQDRDPMLAALVGSEWEIPKDGNIFGLRIVTFTSDSKLIGRYNVEASRREGTWRSVGSGRIELELNGGTIQATFSGNKMQVGRVTLYRRK